MPVPQSLPSPKHTPTPWKFDADNHGMTQEWGYGLLDHTESTLGVTIYDPTNELDAEKVRANAEFIVRAVNSHEALIEVAKLAVASNQNRSDPHSFALAEKAAIALESAGYILKDNQYVLPRTTEQEI